MSDQMVPGGLANLKLRASQGDPGAIEQLQMLGGSGALPPVRPQPVSLPGAPQQGAPQQADPGFIQKLVQALRGG